MIYNNRKFLGIIAAFVLMVPLLDLVGELALSRSFFAFRAWELAKEGRGRAPFRAGFYFEKEIFGDLANMLRVRRFRHYRHQVFSTDSHGFRNREYSAHTYFPVVVMGDSDMAGGSLSDEEIFSNQLSGLLNLPVYNYASWGPRQFLLDERFSKNPPKLVIWEAVERSITGRQFMKYAAFDDRQEYNIAGPGRSGSEYREKLSNHIAKSLYHEFKWRLTGAYPAGIGYVDQETGLLFYAQSVNILKVSNRARDMRSVLHGIKNIERLLARRGISMVFMPLPDKENIYQQVLPASNGRAEPEQPFVEELSDRLDDLGVANVRLYDIFERQAGKFLTTKIAAESPYLIDDTHWSPKGVKEAAKTMAAKLKDLYILVD